VDTPREVVRHVAKQVGVAPATFTRYARDTDGRTRRRHVAAVIEHAGWRTCGQRDWSVLARWLTERALEHDTPTVLFGQALDQLRSERVVRPGLDRLMRAVSSARVNARKEIRRRLDPDLTPERCDELDTLLVTDPVLGVARLVWLNDGATSASTDAVKAEVSKLAYLEALGADRIDLSAIAPERLRQLATIARRSTPRALRQMDPERRHPILLAALAAAHTEIVDGTRGGVGGGDVSDPRHHPHSGTRHGRACTDGGWARGLPQSTFEASAQLSAETPLVELRILPWTVAIPAELTLRAVVA
jgi:hypothetical protein